MGLSAPALLGLAVFLLLVGKIVPRSTLLDKMAEAERWRAAYEAEREARREVEKQTKDLYELAKTTHSVIVAMFQTIDHKREGGNSNESSTLRKE